MLFCGQNHCPRGGWLDFAGDFDTTEEAIVFLADTIKNDHRMKWFHVVCVASKSIEINGRIDRSSFDKAEIIISKRG